MEQKKTPGVYIEEIDAFPNSVVEVQTAVPVFLGLTESALLNGKDVTGTPIRIGSVKEFEQIFGGPAPLSFTQKEDGSFAPTTPRTYLYQAVQMFFGNGASACWITSLGGFATPMDAAAYPDAMWDTLRETPEPALILAPDAVSLSFADYITVTKRMLAECHGLQSRFAILDLHHADQPTLPEQIAAFRHEIDGADGLDYGAVYAPWLHTNLADPSDDDILRLDPASRTALGAKLRKAAPAALVKTLEPLLATLTDADAPPEAARQAHRQLLGLSDVYADTVTALRKAINLVPPGGAIAGIYAMTDSLIGVWKAPANVSIARVAGPAIEISNDMQEDMNVPLDGLAVNAIRSFPEAGVLVWGARTLDGNSQDWRYVNVRRTVIMLEQSIKLATEAYVFAPNDAGTWVTVRSMIENFLTNQWKAGALAGSTPADAFDVSVGLGSTMTGNDILDGYMRVTVRIAVTRPAEFIVLTFQQKMQTS